MNDFDGRSLAAAIADARLVPLDSRNHILLEDEPAWPVFVREVTRLLAEDTSLQRGSAPMSPA